MTPFRWKTLLCSALLSLTAAQPSHAVDDWIGMVTGPTNGTYAAFGLDIADAAKENGVEIRTKYSAGSLDNLNRMNSKENAGFGLVQSDVLGFLARSDDPQAQKTSKKLRMVFPLYNEEIHVFANKSVTTLKDLTGREVSVGERGGGSWLTAKNLFSLLDVRPAKIHYMSRTKAAAAVLSGSLDAMIYVAGKPVDFFSRFDELKKNPAFTEGFNNVHFVPLTEAPVVHEYVRSSIGPEDYPWIENKVDVVAVKAMMVTYDFSSRHNAYYRHRCNQLAMIGQAVRQKSEDFKTTGRTPKWNEVNLDTNIGDWLADTCSRAEPSTANILESGPKVDEKAIYNELINVLQ